MAQHDMNIANQGFPAFRADLNDALGALVSNSSGATAPTTTFAHQFWVDTSANPSVLKQRNADNDAWITIGNIDQTGDKFILVNPEYTGTLTGGTGVVNLGSGQLIKDASGNVGIGITPTQRLHVSGNILATGSVDCGTQFFGLATDTAAAPSFSFTGDTNTGMFRPGTDQVALTTGGTARLTVTTSQFTGTLPWRGQNGTAAAPALSASGDTNTGIYFPAADTIGFVEGGVESMRIDSSGNLLFNSGYGSVATAYGCRAWVNFDGTTSPGTIRASGNVSSVVRSGTGDFTVNFITAMPDANYSGFFNSNSDQFVNALTQFTTTSARCRIAASSVNPSLCTVAIFR